MGRGAQAARTPTQSVLAVRAYQLLPGDSATTVGHLLPVLELVVGACLVLGLLTRGAAVVSALLFVAFIIGIASVWARGITIDCGCFGGGGYDPDAASKYPLGDRPRRRAAPALGVPRLAGPHPDRPRQPAVPAAYRPDLDPDLDLDLDLSDDHHSGV